jgi:hypothetical protein
MIARWFWFGLMIAVIVWYSTITVYVAVRGIADVKQMLRRLADRDRPGG